MASTFRMESLETAGPGAAHDVDHKSKHCSIYQRVSGLLSMFGALVALVMIVAYANGSDYSNGYLGGINFSDLVFNWHPIMMTAAFNFCGIYAMVSFRIFSFGHFMNKIIHASFHFLAVISFSLGLTSVYVSNIYKNLNDGVYYPNFFSLHSFVGLAATILYLQNYILGFLLFLFPKASQTVRARYVSLHIPLGYLFLITATAAIVSGAMELSSENVACVYAPTQAVINSRSIQYYANLPSGCRLLNGFAIIALLATLTAFYCIVDLRIRSDNEQPLIDDNQK